MCGFHVCAARIGQNKARNTPDLVATYFLSCVLFLLMTFILIELKIYLPYNLIYRPSQQLPIYICMICNQSVLAPLVFVHS